VEYKKMNLSMCIDEVKKNTKWKNISRIVGEACELYVLENCLCKRCDKKLEKCKTNEKSRDLVCTCCQQNYQVKAKKYTKNIKETIKLIGAEYNTTMKSLNDNIDYIIVLYLENEVKQILYSNYESINNNSILPRNPLGPTAKRAGWQGCYIKLNIKSF